MQNHAAGGSVGFIREKGVGACQSLLVRSCFQSKGLLERKRVSLRVCWLVLSCLFCWSGTTRDCATWLCL